MCGETLSFENYGAANLGSHVGEREIYRIRRHNAARTRYVSHYMPLTSQST